MVYLSWIARGVILDQGTLFASVNIVSSRSSILTWGRKVMRPSKFNVLIPDFPTAGEYLVFNTFTDSRVVINEELKSVMDRSASSASGGQDPTSLTEEERSHLEVLKELG